MAPTDTSEALRVRSCVRLDLHKLNKQLCAAPDRGVSFGVFMSRVCVPNLLRHRQRRRTLSFQLAYDGLCVTAAILRRYDSIRSLSCIVLVKFGFGLICWQIQVD